jgi:peptidoglycan/LPS O-acetylase OafA/YrhL
MKAFKINRDSWHYKLNKYFFNPIYRWMEISWEPRHSDFCSYWRATITRLVAALALVALAILVVGTIGTVIYMYPIDAIITVGGIILLIAVIMLSEKLKELSANRTQTEQKPNCIAYKDRICPMVEYH